MYGVYVYVCMCGMYMYVVCVYVWCVIMWMCVCVCVCPVWYQSCLGVHVEVRGQLWELILSFYHVGPRNWTEVLRHGNKCHYLWSHLAGPVISLGHQMNARQIPARPPR